MGFDSKSCCSWFDEWFRLDNPVMRFWRCWWWDQVYHRGQILSYWIWSSIWLSCLIFRSLLWCCWSNRHSLCLGCLWIWALGLTHFHIFWNWYFSWGLLFPQITPWMKCWSLAFSFWKKTFSFSFHLFQYASWWNPLPSDRSALCEAYYDFTRFLTQQDSYSSISLFTSNASSSQYYHSLNK